MPFSRTPSGGTIEMPSRAHHRRTNNGHDSIPSPPSFKDKKANSQLTRILLVEDHAILREALSALLAKDPSFEMVGAVGTGREAINLVPSLKPDLIMIDLSLPGHHGIEVIRDIHKAWNWIKILVFTGHTSVEIVRAAFEAGAVGYVVKQDSHEELRLAIKSVVAGRTYVSPIVANSLVAHYVSGDTANRKLSDLWHKLTPREREVLKMVAEGARNKEIAEHLCLSVRTVEKHRLNLMAKLKLKSVAALTMYAIQHKLIGSPDHPIDPPQVTI